MNLKMENLRYRVTFMILSESVPKYAFKFLASGSEALCKKALLSALLDSFKQELKFGSYQMVQITFKRLF